MRAEPSRMMVHRSILSLVVAASVAACERAPAPDSASSASATASARPAEAPPAVAEGGTAMADSGADASVGAPASSAPFTTSTANAPVPLEGEEFLPQARALFRVGACGSTGEIPSRFDPAVVAKYCDQLGHASGEYKKS